MILLILVKRVCLGVWRLGQWRKKCAVVSISLPQSHNGFRVSWKQCLNLWSRRWLRPSRNLVGSLIPYGLWILKILFVQGRIKFSRFFLKTERLLFKKIERVLFKNWEDWENCHFCSLGCFNCWWVGGGDVRQQVLFRAGWKIIFRVSGFIRTYCFV